LKVAIICGAGATLSEAAKAPAIRRPPLDREFFRIAKRAKSNEVKAVEAYLSDFYGTDITSPLEDSLERVMAVLYSDLLNPAIADDHAASAFRALLRLVHKRISETTNQISANRKCNLYRIVYRLIDKNRIRPSDISIITFNYDLHVERTLFSMQFDKVLLRPIIVFPKCYSIASARMSLPPKSIPVFKQSASTSQGVNLYKLHGSLNWFSMHDVAEPEPKDLIDKNSELWITPRTKTTLDMTMTYNKKRRFTFPVIVPPVVNKAAILHSSLGGIWQEASECLKEATHVIVFGYSCPAADQESANLFARSLRTNEELAELAVIDPSTATLERIAQLSNARAIKYFKDANAYIDAP
jgi:hypothetical protein